MRHSRWLVLTLVALVIAFLLGSVPALGSHEKPTEIHGVISRTLTITEDSRLTGDVECEQLDNGPCILFGRPNIKLSLNGFKMTGPANEPPRANCVTAGNFTTQEADGIQSRFDEVQ